jgi:peptide/nickel transport system substrate-binding protein
VRCANNLVMYKQDVAQASMNSIVPDLAESWSWNEEGTELTFPLRQGVRWHDGKPFTARDVKCTWDLLQGKVGGLPASCVASIRPVRAQ